VTVKKLTLTAILTALALALGLLERFLPISLLIPLPGVKLGLSNIVTLFALCVLGTPYAAAILLLRAVLGSVFSGSVTSLLYSLAGGALALTAMAIASRSKRLSVYGVSMIGAAMHSIGQILAAMAVIGSVSIVSYLPLLLVISAVTGALTGAATGGVLVGWDAYRKRMPSGGSL
jgi:heptaprenyl diphosphate synthase